MSENITPESFDLADWLSGGTNHRPTKTVTVYRDLYLAAELERVREQIASFEDAAPRNSEGNPEESLGGTNGTQDLEAKAEELLSRIQSVKVTLTIRGLIRPEIEAILEDLKGRGLDQSVPEYDYEVLSQAVDFPGGRTLTPVEWRKFHGVIGQGQFNRVVQAYQAAQNIVPEVTAPFSRRSSRQGNGR